MALKIPDFQQSYTERDVIIYALGIGVGYDPLEQRTLRFFYEKNLQPLPTMPLILSHPGFWMRDLPTGIDSTRIVHGEQSIEIHRELPTRGNVVGRTTIVDIVDKGPGRGAIVVFDRDLIDCSTREVIASMRQSNFCRGEGGFNGPAREQAKLPDLPRTAPHFVVDLPTRPETALLYRLSGDLNPLHVDPIVAQAAGFSRPILHGLATFAIAGHAILRDVCNYESSRVKSLSGRFTSPVFPGETIRTEIWQLNTKIRFRCLALERGVVALSDGTATVAANA